MATNVFKLGSLSCCCGPAGPVTPCVTPCMASTTSPLYLTVKANLFFCKTLQGPYTMIPGGGAWSIGCDASVAYFCGTYNFYTATLSSCTGGNPAFIFNFMFLTSGSCADPTTVGGTCTDGCTNPAQALLLVDYTCTPFHLHFQPTATCSSCTNIFTDVYIDA